MPLLRLERVKSQLFSKLSAHQIKHTKHNLRGQPKNSAMHWFGTVQKWWNREIKGKATHPFPSRPKVVESRN